MSILEFERLQSFNIESEMIASLYKMFMAYHKLS